MRKKLCVYPSCKSDSRYYHKEHMKDIFFIPFPKAKKSFDKCQKWINWLNRNDYPLSRVNDNTYLCSKHFVGGKGPTKQFPDPIHHHSEYVSILKRNITNDEPALDNHEPSMKMHSEALSETDQVSVEQDRDISLPLIESSFSLSDGTIGDVLYVTNWENMDTSEISESHVSATNLRNLVESFSFPIEWAARLVHAGLKLYKFKQGTDSIMYCVKLDEEFFASYEVLGKSLKNIERYKLPYKINSKNILKNVLLLIEGCKPCKGNSETDMLSIFENRPQKTGFQSLITGGIHSVNCELLMQESARKRCFFCAKQRLSFQVTISRKRKKSETSITRYSNLDKEELAQKLRKSKNSEILVKRKLRRLQQKMCVTACTFN